MFAGLMLSFLFAGTAPAVATPLSIETDTRIGGVLLRGKDCLYAVGGGNVFGTRQVMRIVLDKQGTPIKNIPSGEINPKGVGQSAAAIHGRWLFVTGGDHNDKTVRFEIGVDGRLSNRIELANEGRPAFSWAAMVASGKYLVLAGGWNSRLVYLTEVKGDGSIGPWQKGLSLPCICFTSGRLFRIGRRLFVAGNQTYQGASDRVYSSEVGEDGYPGRWRRWAELPDCVGDFRFCALPDDSGVFYESGESGEMYTAPVDAEGNIGDWKKASGLCPVEPALSTLGLPLDGKRYLRYMFFGESPRKFHSPIVVPY